MIPVIPENINVLHISGDLRACTGPLFFMNPAHVPVLNFVFMHRFGRVHAHDTFLCDLGFACVASLLRICVNYINLVARELTWSKICV